MMSTENRAGRRCFVALSIAAAMFGLASCGGSPLESTSTTSLSVDSITYSPSAPKSGNPVSVASSISAGSSISSSDISYVWTQTSGPSATLTGVTSSTVYFTAPTVSVNTEMVLTLTVSAGTVSASKSVAITVAP